MYSQLQVFYNSGTEQVWVRSYRVLYRSLYEWAILRKSGEGKHTAFSFSPISKCNTRPWQTDSAHPEYITPIQYRTVFPWSWNNMHFISLPFMLECSQVQAWPLHEAGSIPCNRWQKKRVNKSHATTTMRDTPLRQHHHNKCSTLPHLPWSPTLAADWTS